MLFFTLSNITTAMLVILYHLIIFKNLGFTITIYFQILISTFIEDRFPIIVDFQEGFFVVSALLLNFLNQ